MPHSETDEYGRAIARAFSTVGLTSADLVRLEQHRDSRIILGGAYRTMRRMLENLVQEAAGLTGSPASHARHRLRLVQ